MSKIDIAIKVTSGGAGEPFVVNGGEWTRHIIDVRHLLGNLKNIDKEHQVARILRFTDDGCLLIVSRLISGRSGDNIAAWIHIPATAEVSGSEVVRVMRLAESVILQSSVNMEPLSEFATNEYPNSKSYCQAPQGQSLAFRRYDEVNLPQLLGNNRYQAYYDRYQYIYLLDMESSVDIAEGVVAHDLTHQQVEPISMLLPPESADLQRHFGYKVTVALADGTPFDHPIALKKGESILVYFMREGFKPVECGVRKDNSDAFSTLKLPFVRDVKWKKTIVRSLFRFVDERGKELPADVHPTIKVNGQELGAAGMEMAEGYLRQVNIVANAKKQGYEGESAFFDLSQPAPYTLRLTRRLHDYNNKVEMRNGQTAEMTLVSKYLEDGKDGPLAGYTYDSHSRKLVYDKSRVWAHRAQGLLAGLLLMGLCWGISAIVGSQKDKKPNVAVVDEPKPGVDSTQINITEPESTQEMRSDDLASTDTIEAAIAYLDGHEKWNRDSMENNTYLRGLFNDMNKYNLNYLCGFWYKRLKDSDNFMDVYYWAMRVKDAKKNPATPEKRTYTTSTDPEITVLSYIDKLFKTISLNNGTSNATNSSTSIHGDKRNSKVTKKKDEADAKHEIAAPEEEKTINVYNRRNSGNN